MIWHTTVRERAFVRYPMLPETDEASGQSTISVVDFLDHEWGYRPSGVMSARAEVVIAEEDLVDVALLNYAIH